MEYIAECEVIEYYPFGEAPNKPRRRIVKVKIVDLLKGNIRNDTIDINIGNPVLIKWADEYFAPNNKIIILFRFMEFRKDSYYASSPKACLIGTKNMKKRITEILKIHDIRNIKRKAKKVVDWSIRCLEEEETMYQGALALHKKGPFYKYYPKSKRYKKLNFKLRDDQTEYLKNYFLNREQLEYWDFYILDILKLKENKEVLAKLISQLKLIDKERLPLEHGRNLMKKISELRRDKTLKSIYKELNQIRLLSEQVRQKELTKMFIENL